jgi:electron transport complex protein RnfG
VKAELLTSIRRNSISLMLISTFVAVILALVYQLSADRIAEQQTQNERARLAEIFPSDAHDNDLLDASISLHSAAQNFRNPELLGLREDALAYLARTDNVLSGIILPAIARDGYNGDIQLLVGLRASGEITGVRVVQHRETPGLGDRIETRISDWILGFNGKSLASTQMENWTVKKSGGDFDQFTGATITPRAVITKVHDVLNFYQQNEQIFRSL